MQAVRPAGEGPPKALRDIILSDVVVVVTFIRSKATGHTSSTDPSRSHYITSVGGRLKPTHRRRVVVISMMEVPEKELRNTPKKTPSAQNPETDV